MSDGKAPPAMLAWLQAINLGDYVENLLEEGYDELNDLQINYRTMLIVVRVCCRRSGEDPRMFI